MSEPEPIDDLLKRVDIKAAKIDPKAQYLFVASADGDAADLVRVVHYIKQLVPNAAVLMFNADIEAKLYDISGKHTATLPVKQISVIQDREAARRI